MKRALNFLSANRPYILLGLAVLALLAWLMLYRLGTLVSGLSRQEYAAALMPVGWHGIYHDSLYLPLKAVRSVDFYFFSQHNAILTRLPNALFGAIAVISFTWLIRLWHNRRTALIAGLLFATGAWTLHASRLASFDVLYLCVIPVLLLMNVALQRHTDKKSAMYASMLLWGLLIYIPGAVWMVLINAFLQRKSITKGWTNLSAWWHKTLYVLAGVIWLPLLVYNLRDVSILKSWLGLPAHLEGPLTLLKNFIDVFSHLFIGGPRQPDLWLGKAPILDVFTLAMFLIGLYFYAIHWRASRSKLLGSLFLAGAILVALGGPVTLSLLVPLLYIVAATGITYLIKEWLQVFPNNPIARNAGLALIALAVILACTYNLRAYFVAWPHNNSTITVFHYRP